MLHAFKPVYRTENAKYVKYQNFAEKITGFFEKIHVLNLGMSGEHFLIKMLTWFLFENLVTHDMTEEKLRSLEGVWILHEQL